MMKPITRRDFLKLAGLLPLSIAAPKLANPFQSVQQGGNLPNVVIVVFDAFSARNISLYGYQRETTPNLARLAERAIVYHNHHAGGNFTAPGTATLLTGTLPWAHRAFNHAGKVVEAFVKENIFTAFENYYRVAYSHNPMANGLLKQFKDSLDNYIPRAKFFLNDDTLIPSLFKNDDDIATISWLRAVKGVADETEESFAYSLFLSHLVDAYEKYQDRKIVDLQPQFPMGLPSIFTDNYYMLEDAINWFGSSLPNLPKPFLSYLHFMPPHAPYRTHREFYGHFKNDGWYPPVKPFDLFSREVDHDFEHATKKRASYDEFILYVDRGFGRLFDYLENSGILENTWLVLTSDHGETFERGIIGHTTPVLYEPLINIPLMIFKPGGKTRTDVHVPTSAVDLLPTLLHVIGQPEATWAEGVILPPFSTSTHSKDNRSIYAVEARKNDKFAPLNIATIALIKDPYKLMYSFGYDESGGKERVELYDIENDPDEMNNLYLTKKEVAGELFNELKTKIAEVNAPYL